MIRACLIAAKGNSNRWPGKNAETLPGVLASVPKWMHHTVVGTDCDRIAGIALDHGASVIRRHDVDDNEPVADVWRWLALFEYGDRYFCPLANVTGLLQSDFWHADQRLFHCDQVKSYGLDGLESGLFACNASVLLENKPIAAYTGMIRTHEAKEVHYAHEA